ncbi:MAG: DUF853 family protein [Rhodospirillales bacterium]|nr:DUF853 family protein [Rhodospirillales bacterium]
MSRATGNSIRLGAGKGIAATELALAFANRHGLIAGATGTGKTVTLRAFAEGFSAAGVPVFLADVKGDLSGLCRAAEPSPQLAQRAITELEVGEALVSTLAGRGVPTPAARVRIRPPASRLAPLSAAERKSEIEKSPLSGRYETPLDRESAYEILTERRGPESAPAATTDAGPGPWGSSAPDTESPPSRAEPARPERAGGGILEGVLGGAGASRARGGRGREGLGEAFVKSVARSIGSQVGRQIVRGVLGAMLK